MSPFLGDKEKALVNGLNRINAPHRLDKAPFSAKVESARPLIDEWEQGQHEKLSRKVQKAREDLDRAEQLVQEKLGRKR